MEQNSTSEDVLTGKKLKAVEALIACDTIDEACTVCGVTRSTIYRYLKEPLFEKELKTAKRQLINRAILRLQQTCGDATRALAEICRDKKAPPSSRVSAAKEILSSALKSIELEEFEDRLKRLEDKYLNK